MSKTERNTDNGKMVGYNAGLNVISEDVIEKDTVLSSTQKPMILVVDEKPETLTIIARTLASGFQVMSSTHGPVALKMAEKHSPALFLLALEMPQMDGYALAHAIREQPKFKRVPIIFLINKNTREDTVSAIMRGGYDYLGKPVDKDLLLSKVLQYLEGA